MYTYIYTENNNMDMYRVGKVVDLTGGTRRDFDTSADKHKGILFPNGITASYNVVFHDAANTNPGGITLAMATAVESFVLPCVVKAVTSSAAARIILLG